MAAKRKLPKELRKRIDAVTNKRARFVLDVIALRGLITTEELQKAGYEHPPRAAQDARDLGFSLKTIKVKHSNGRTIAAYVFDEGELDPNKAGRRLLPKSERDLLIVAAGSQCNLCGARQNLQVDHRVPYEVAGESQRDEEKPFQILDGSCNRKKSWSCEHCRNLLELKDLDICRTCYWAGHENYTHVAMRQERRVEIVWTGEETKDFDVLKSDARKSNSNVVELIKKKLAADATQTS